MGVFRPDRFARSATLDSAGLRDHVKQMLQAIALDIQTSQTDREQYLKSKGLAPALSCVETAAETHGSLRYSAGFDLTALVAEFRALRATVLRLWVNKGLYRDDATVYELARFNEAIDQAVAESVAAYSEELTKSRETFLTSSDLEGTTFEVKLPRASVVSGTPASAH